VVLLVSELVGHGRGRDDRVNYYRPPQPRLRPPIRCQPFNLGKLMIKRLPALSYESAQTDLSSGLRFVAGLEPSSSLLHGTVEQAVCRSSADR